MRRGPAHVCADEGKARPAPRSLQERPRSVVPTAQEAFQLPDSFVELVVAGGPDHVAPRAALAPVSVSEAGA